MVVFPEVAAGIGLTVTTFTLCIEGLQAIARARQSPGAMTNFTIGIDLEISRLLLWGRNAGVAAGRLDKSLEPLQDGLDRILGALSSSLQDVHELKTKYGISVIDDIDKDSQPASSRGEVDILAMPLPIVQASLDRHKTMSQKLSDQTGVFRKVKWAIMDGKKALILLRDIRSYVNGLNQLLTESQKATLDAEMTAMKIAILGTDWAHPIKALAAIEKATSGSYESITIPARLARMRLEMELETVAPTLSLDSPLLDAPLKLDQDQIRPLDSYRALARYRDRDIVIEWRILSSAEATGEMGKARSKQTGKLVRIFQEIRGHETQYPILECIGLVDQKHHIPPRLGIAFGLPSKALSHSPSIPHSLHGYLSSPDFESFLPPLGDRFELARKIARGFLQFFQLGWHHKSICSHIINFLPGVTSPCLDAPFIMGFAFSRPQEKGISDQERRNDEYELYRHPDYQGLDQPGHRLLYDMYSIGMLLFEIGTWRPLKSYFDRLKRSDKSLTNKSFGSKLIERESAKLAFQMGRHFKDAAVVCLTGDLGTEDKNSGNRELKIAYLEKVIKKLELCRA